jgi:hypothetical protein
MPPQRHNPMGRDNTVIYYAVIYYAGERYALRTVRPTRSLASIERRRRRRRAAARGRRRALLLFRSLAAAPHVGTTTATATTPLRPPTERPLSSQHAAA